MYLKDRVKEEIACTDEEFDTAFDIVLEHYNRHNLQVNIDELILCIFEQIQVQRCINQKKGVA